MIHQLKRLFRNPEVPHSGKALDVGFGSGEIALLLAQHGFDVTAIDSDEEKVTRFSEKKETGDVKTQIQVVRADVTNFPITPETFSCIVANNILPFIADKKTVIEILHRAYTGLSAGGFIAFSLFGPKDAWSERKTMSFFEYQEGVEILRALGADIYFQSTEEGFGPTNAGEIKFWHIHRFIVRKK